MPNDVNKKLFEEMQLSFLILVLCCYIHNSSANESSTDAQWRQSRYIIDNRRNALFSKKLPTALLQPQEDPPKEFYPVERYHKDLSAEASISEPKYYQNYGENSLPRKIIKTYKLPAGFDSEYVGIYENRKNTTLDPHNFIHSEEDIRDDVVKTTEKIWVGKEIIVSPTTAKHPDNTGTTVSYPWEIAKTEQNNQIDNNEKHVYETRIETVSYHQEVIFNPPKKQTWYPEQKPKNYEPPEENYEEPEKNYEQPEENYEEEEKNYEEVEKNYDLDMSREGEAQQDSQNKFGYVVEGTNYRKYRVEERTVDGFIVGEYGVVSHDDGSLRGVRYTADGNTNPKLIYETLIKFLSL